MMSPAPRPGRRGRAVAIAAVLTLAVGCGGGDRATIADPGGVPVQPHGAPSGVDVCRLLSPRDTADLLDRALRPVGLAYGAARVETLECGLGKQIGVDELSVQLAVGPLSAMVFEDAYGEPAGGDPVFVKRLGQAAFLRTETGDKSLHVLVHGSVLTLRARLGGDHPIGRTALVQLAEAALTGLPSNPVLAPTTPGARCSHVALSSVTAAIGAQPSVVSQFDGPDGAVQCSWGSQPGAAEVTVVTDLGRVSAYRRIADSGAYQSVDLAGVGADVSAVSRTDRAGDLLIVSRRWAVLLTVMPTAGFSNPRIVTTPGEGMLATAVVTALT